jgi:hypothetical protein
MDFSTQAGFTHYIELDDANADTFARLADFVTRSITAQSIALGTGSASSILSF